ncbi:MAG: thioredoxin [Desulfobacter sp.]|nr:MAG: thioredoxin [Desulfobacter sp.]
MMADPIIFLCPKCRAKNRVPAARLKDHPLCGHCKAPLVTEDFGKVVRVTDSDFDTMIMDADLPVLVDCWAPWCGHCLSMAPILDDLAQDYAGRVRIFRLNLDENPGIGARFGINSVPTLLLVKNKKIRQTLVGARAKETMVAAVERLL